MKAVDESQRLLCALQGRVFAWSRESSAFSSAVFVRRFMLSDTAASIDKLGLECASLDPKGIASQIGGLGTRAPYGTTRYTEEELYWMGYLYRYWCCATGLSSKAVYRIIGARELRDLFYPYHSLDVAQAIERIQEAKQVPSDRSSIAYGVVTLRRIRAEYESRRSRG